MGRPSSGWGAISVALACIAVLTVLTVACSAIASATPAAVVRLTSLVSVGAGDVHLRDVATVETADASLKARLEGVILGPAPAAGRARRIRQDYMVLRIRQQRVDPSVVAFAGPEFVELTLREGPAGGVAGGIRGTAGGEPLGGALLVTRGQEVTVEAVLGPVSVVTSAKALDSGRMGQSVRVQIGAAARTVSATVSDTGRVFLDMGE